MLLIGIAVICLALFAFAFAYLMDKHHGPVMVVILFAWMWTMQPVHAQDNLSDAGWPSIQEPTQAILVGHNIFGDKIVLFANFCQGDGARHDHMHTYGIYNQRGMFLAGGCWQWNPQQLKTQRTISYFDMGGAGWSQWPASSFKLAK